MAHMIPAEPKEFDARSHEGIVFEALKSYRIATMYSILLKRLPLPTRTNCLLRKRTSWW